MVRGDAGAEEPGRNAIDRAITAASHLVQRAAPDAADRDSRIHLGDSKRKHRSARAMTRWRALAASLLLTSRTGFGRFCFCSNL